MYSTSIYQYIQRQLVVINIGNSPRRYLNVYSKTLKLHKGVDNRLQFQLLNQEQKPVDITTYSIIMRIISDDGYSILYQNNLNPTLALNGIAEIVIRSEELVKINTQKAWYSLENNDGTLSTPLYMNGNTDARGTIDIVDSVLPKFKQAEIVTIPTYPPIIPTGVTYTSSVYIPTLGPYTTVQLYYNNFSGSIMIQGSTAGTTEWYDITTDARTTDTTVQGYVLEGYHPYIRIKFVSTLGSVDKILVR